MCDARTWYQQKHISLWISGTGTVVGMGRGFQWGLEWWVPPGVWVYLDRYVNIGPMKCTVLYDSQGLVIYSVFIDGKFIICYDCSSGFYLSILLDTISIIKDKVLGYSLFASIDQIYIID